MGALVAFVVAGAGFWLPHDVVCDVAKPRPKQNAGMGDPLYLRRDPRLHVKLSLELGNPTAKELLERLCQATGLTLTLDKGLEHNRFDYGHMNFRDVPACGLMELMAERGLEGGHWVRAEGGYRLVGRIRPELGSDGQITKKQLALLWGSIGALFVILVFYGRNKRPISCVVEAVSHFWRNTKAAPKKN